MALSPDHRIGTILVLTSTLAWSTAGLFTRVLALDAATILVWRGLFGAAGLIGLGLMLDGRAHLSGWARLGRAGWAYALISGTGMGCFIASLTLTTVAHVAVIYATVPFLAAILSWAILAEAPGRAALVASVLAFAGTLLMLGFGGEGRLVGDALALGMTLSMALMIVLARRHPGIPTLPAAALSGLLAALVALPFATLAPLPAPATVGLLAAFGLVNSAVGLGLFLLGSARIPPVETALIGALEAPLAPLWVWLMLDETPGPATLWGGALVMVAVLGHILWQARPRAGVASGRDHHPGN